MATLHIYSRVSSDSQEENTSLVNQKEKGISLATRLGFEHKVWNEGAASSAKDTLDNRPVLQDLLKEIDDGRVKHLYAEYNDRLSRNATTLYQIRYSIIKNEVLFYTGADITPNDLNDDMSNLLFGIMGEIATFENSQRTRRLHTGKFNRVKEGKFLGGPPPFGYRIASDKTLEIEPEEAEWVRKAHEYIADRKTIRDIRELFRENFVRTRRGNMVWSVGSIEKMLKNTHHGGYYVVTNSKTKKSHTIDCPSIVGKQLKQTVNQYFANRSPRKRVRAPNLKRINLLSDYLYCGGCDCGDFKWRQKDTKQSRVYYCPSREEAYRTTNPDQKSCTDLKSIKIAETDDLVWNAVVESMSASNLFKETVKESALEKGSLQADKKQLQKLKRKLKESEKELKKTTEGIGVLQGRLLVQNDKDELRAAVNSLEVDRETLRTDITALRSTIENAEEGKKWVDWVGDFDKKIESLGFETDVKVRLEFLSEVVESIYVRTLDKKTNLVELDIRFKLPYIGDALNYKSANKSDGYQIVEGSKSLKKIFTRSDART